MRYSVKKASNIIASTALMLIACTYSSTTHAAFNVSKCKSQAETEKKNYYNKFHLNRQINPGGPGTPFGRWLADQNIWAAQAKALCEQSRVMQPRIWTFMVKQRGWPANPS